MSFELTTIDGQLVARWRTHPDERGFVAQHEDL
jgi:hypothetical protein